MNKEEFDIELIEKAKKINIDISKNQSELFFEYMNLLIEWNKKINLTAITEANDIILKHFIDSINIIKYIKETENVLDIGTGAGFPGIPLKILLSNNEFVLLDSLNKRIAFLNNVIENLNLKNINAEHNRAEDFIKKEKQRNGYDVVVSRAVAKLNVLVEYMLPFTKIGGICICMKSFEIKEELEEAKNAIEILGGELEKIDTINLPDSDIKRKIIIIKKIKATPLKYPRKAGTPVKEPI